MSSVSFSKNALGACKSPYLRQHAKNPVHWQPWSDDAFLQAQRTGKPVFLSIGYAACHWCHVMAHESFEDAQVAELLNREFVCVKVDREERPDVDAAYMRVCQSLTGQGGWPLTAVLTPQGAAFFAGTYFPKRARSGMVGLLDILPQLVRAWREERERVLDTAKRVSASAARSFAYGRSANLSPDMLDDAFFQLSSGFDAANGGFGTAPKFPSPTHLFFLLRYFARTQKPLARTMASRTLLAMAQGGIRDCVGGGFHRYATDAAWRVPHFEKMLYDQSLLALAYLEAHQLEKNDRFARIASETLDYVLRDLQSPEGAFFTARDADSPGGEGAFYTWTLGEVRAALPDPDFAVAVRAFNLLEEGNFRDEATGARTGRNVLALSGDPAALARDLGLSERAFEAACDRILKALFLARERRKRPELDDKVLTDMNGLAVAALSRGARVLGQAAYARAAVRCADYLLSRHGDGEGGVVHWPLGTDPAFATLDDHAFLLWGLLELYATTRNPRWLLRARTLALRLCDAFSDPDGGFFFTSAGAPGGLARLKEGFDHAVPSGNAVAAHALLWLSRLFGDARFATVADGALSCFWETAHHAPLGFTHLLCAADLALGPSYVVVVAGKQGGADTDALLDALDGAHLPHVLVLFQPEGEPPVTPLCKGKKTVGGRAAAYVCTQKECMPPVHDPDSLFTLLRGARESP